MAVTALARVVLLAVATLAAAVFPASAQTDVDVELILAVDISMSMDPDEQRLQRDGYIAALRDPGIIKAIQAGPQGRIAVTYIEWAGPANQQVLVPWRLIDGPASAKAFTDELAARPYSRYRMTSISAALEFSWRQFDDAPYRGTRRVIDVSGDGANNSGGQLTPIRDRIVASGIVINGLPILLRPTMAWTGWDIPDLDLYYANCVIGGPGAFSIPIREPREFLTATRQKLLLEISGIAAWPRILPAQQTLKDARYDCGVLERGFGRW